MYYLHNVLDSFYSRCNLDINISASHLRILPSIITEPNMLYTFSICW